MASAIGSSTSNSDVTIKAFLCADPTGSKALKVIIPNLQIAFGSGYTCLMGDPQASHMLQQQNALFIPKDVADDASRVINSRGSLRSVKDNLTEYAYAFYKAAEAGSSIADPNGVEDEERAYVYTTSNNQFGLYLPSVNMIIEHETVALRPPSDDCLKNAIPVCVLTFYVQRLHEIYSTIRLAQSNLNNFIEGLE